MLSEEYATHLLRVQNHAIIHVMHQPIHTMHLSGVP